MQPLISEFTLIGKLEKVVIKSEKCIKSFKLATSQGEYEVKVSKELRNRLSEIRKQLKLGCSLKVVGKKEYKVNKGKVKYEADLVEFLEKPQSKFVEDSDSPLDRQSSTIEAQAQVKPKAKVLFCQKSTCWKKGGKAAYEALQEELENRGLADRVTIQKTGCLKQCKKAPNMVMMPDKARYSKVKEKQVVGLIDKHLLTCNSHCK